MAEGWARHLKADKLAPFSAGIEKHGLNPNAVRVMSEVGVDISSQESQTVADLGPMQFDVVVTVCGHADEHCPLMPAGTRKLHWAFDDPARAEGGPEQITHVFATTRDAIRERVEALLAELPTD